jgi:hypothetical protein
MVAIQELSRGPAIVAVLLGLGVVERAFIGADVVAGGSADVLVRSGRHVVMFGT